MSYEPAAHQQAPAAYQAPAPQAVQPARPTTLAHTNAFALVSVILAFLVPIAGVVFGHLALGQIKRNGDSGRGLALTGLIVGYAYIALIALMVIAYIGMIIVMFASLGAAFGEFGSYGGYGYNDYYDSEW